MTASSPLVLVDGSSYLFRAFHAMPPLTNKAGEPTGAMLGVVNMLHGLIGTYNPTHMAVVFDAKGKTFRNDMYKEYKATRPPMPDDLRSQIEPLHEIIRLMGLPLLSVAGVEADDVIGTLSVQASEAGHKVVISTSDKDLAQLVNENVTLINTMSRTTLDIDGVIEKFGVPPNRIIDYLALMGDTSDNIPGVVKCGPKTAVKWLGLYDSFEGVIANADQVKGKIGENLRAALPTLPLSYDLATIKLDVELDQKISELTIAEPDKPRLRKYLERYEFKSWLNELDGKKPVVASTGPVIPEAAKVTRREYQQIISEEDLHDWLQKITAAGTFAFDTETTSIDYMQAEIVGVSFSIEPGSAAYVPLAHDYDGAPVQLDRELVLERLKPLLESAELKKIGQNLKYDRNVLLNYDIDLQGIEHDTMLQSYVCDAAAHRHDMDELASKYLNYKTIHFEDIAGKGKKQLTFNQIEVEPAAEYAAEDADIALQLHNALWQVLSPEPILKAVYCDIEMPLLRVLSNVERNGVLVDADKLAEQSGELATSIAEIEQQAYEDAGQEFNLGSSKQIGDLLYRVKEIPVIRKTPKGQPSTAEDVLEQLAQDYVLPRLILNYRSLSKLKSTYTDKLPLQINERSGRVHTSYQQAVASTGRLSSTDPNLQNIPVRTHEGRRIREAFVAPEGYRVVAADYSQIELRIMAHLSADDNLLGAFADGLDIHSATAAEVFGHSLDEVDADSRRAAKAINFGLIYGMSAFGLARQLDIPRGDAQQYIDLYFERYPGVKRYMDSTKTNAKMNGFVETVYGRRLYLPEIESRNYQRRQYAERTAINAPMQGTAADIIKRAMIRVDHWLETEAVDAKVIMQVHDELVLEVAAGDVEAVSTQLSTIMSDAASLAVPLEVEVGVGDNWQEAH
ncbi:DNA polymerase I [Chromatiales bacterium (ex Bugula neritina AB1)]|nr:DNA polymerase I [Chromatiales bacterium (ex Bugula neritina AB1)]